MKILLIFFSVIAIASIIILSYFFYGITQNPKFEEIVKIWANFGDFMGGTLNPILAALSLFGLLFTIYYQNKELEETRKELIGSRIAQEEQSESLKLQNKATKLQMFETTFFQLNNLVNITKGNISIKVNNVKTYRRGNSQEFTLSNRDYNVNRIIFDSEERLNGNEAIKKYLMIYKVSYIDEYDKFNTIHEEFIGAYFGQVYQLLNFTNESYKENKIEQPQRYINIFRAQFSKDELVLLFFHCLGKIGKRKFKKLVEGYEFFEHISLNNDIEKQLLEYDIKAFGKNENIIKKYNELKEKKPQALA